MFQDEARFGRLSDPRSCWAPKPFRPKVGLALIREYVYAYAAVSPMEGDIDWMMAEKMNSCEMDRFLDMIEEKYLDDHIVMILDGASSHRSKELKIRGRVSFLWLPPYSPELNPVEHVWDELREKEFANRVFDSLQAARAQTEAGLRKFQSNSAAVSRLTAWPWITNAIIST
jgi:hypothetical protein